VSEGNPVVPGSFAPGSRIAGYLLEEQIGQGGMAVVFRAHDERLDRTVALKILAPALAADEAFRQRFIRESRAAAAVDDPHIIPVFEAGEASGVLFIVMRWVRGGDVRSLVGQFGPMAPGRAADVISQVASALDAAHTRGLVHRDVKPANMLLDASSGSGRPDHVYLSDFGLSKGSLQTSGLTGTGTFLGTLDYISPEQIEGKPVDGRADEYALACAAFELLTGAPPFQRDEAMAVMYAQLSEPPPALSSRRGGLPLAVDNVFIKALAKAPAERYGTCTEFAEALRVAFGLRPYDSGPGGVPSGGHPATRIVRPSDPAVAGPGVAAAGAVGPGDGTAPHGAVGGYAGQGAGHGVGEGAGQGAEQVGLHGQTPAAYPGPGYAGLSGDVVEASLTPPGQVQAPGQGDGPSGPPSGDVPGGPGAHGAAPTELAMVGRRTEPDLTAPRWHQASPGGPGAGGVGQGDDTHGYGLQGYGQYGGPDPQASLARPWWKSPLALIAAVVVLIGGGAAAYALTKGGGGGANNGGGNNNPTVAAGLKAPGCTASAAPGHTVARSSFVAVPNNFGDPFGIATTRDGTVFVVTDSSVQIFKSGPNGSLRYTGLHLAVGSAARPATSAVLTHDGRYLLVAVDNGIQVFNVKAAESGSSDANVGMLSVPGVSSYGRAVGLAVTVDDQYAFVALQFANKVGVFNLGNALRFKSFSRAYMGSLNVGGQPVGLTVSPDGKTLYATNFVQNSPVVPGKLTVVDIAKLTAPNLPPSQFNSAIVAQVPAGCNPARIVVTPDNKTVWVTARQSNYLLGFSASRLGAGSANALIAKVHVGQQPISLILLKGGSRIVVSDNDNTDPPQTAHNLAVVDPNAAVLREQALLGYIPSGLTPRDFALSVDGRFLYVTNRNSSKIQVISLSKLP
jgi:DNA-binding beta-propeller fold protein YncE